MAIEEMKQRLYTLIEASNNEVLLEDLLVEAQKRTQADAPHEIEGLSKEDFEELVLLAEEPVEKDTLAYDELKSSLNRWFTKLA